MRLLSTAATLTLLGTVTHGKNHPHLTMKQNLAQLQHGGGGDLLDYDVRKSTTGGNVGTGGADKGGFFGGAKDLMPKLPPLSFEDRTSPRLKISMHLASISILISTALRSLTYLTLDSAEASTQFKGHNSRRLSSR